MSQLIHIFDVILQQHCDPIAFLEDQRNYPQKLWWPAWLWRGGIALVGLVILGFAAMLSEQRWGEMVAYAMLPLIILLVSSATAVMITQQPQFWFLYVFSPPALIVALLFGLILLSPIWLVPGWGIGLPFLLGAFVSDAGALWVNKRLDEIQRDRQRMRTGGPVAELPALALWQRVRFVRLIVSIGVSFIILFLFLRGQVAILNHLALLAGLAGCLHLDATLLSWPGKSPLARFNQQRGQWRTTYVGRSALFIPLKRMREAIAPTLPVSETSARLLVLLQQGSLGPVVRRASKELSSEQAHRLILYLSIQEGGAASIRYLKPAQSPSFHSTMECYAALATEAAKPFELQRWITVLTNQLPTNTNSITELEADLRQTLSHTRDALLTHTYVPVIIEGALRNLQHLIQSLYDLPSPATSEEQSVTQLKNLPLTWPVALLFHLESHRKRQISP